MRINPSQNKCSFKSRIEFVSFEKMFQLSQTPNAVEVGTDLLKDCGGLSTPRTILAPGVGSCTMYAMVSSKLKNALIGHYNKSAQTVTSFIESFARRGRALVAGGNIEQGLNIYFKTDIEAFRDKLPTTIFWGQNDGFTNAFYNLDTDTWSINKVMQLGKIVSAASVEDIKSAFKIIHISEGDTVFVRGKAIDSKLLNQNDEAYSWS